MKITKTFISVFLSALIIGCIAVLTTKKKSPPEKSEKINLPLQNYHDFTKDIRKPETEPNFEPEIFNIVPDWEEDEPEFKMKLIDVLEIGNGYRKEEVLVKSGEIWLGLFEENGKFCLRNTKVRVRPERRQNYGNDVVIRVKDKTEPKFLLKNADNLREGKIETLFNRPTYKEAERLGIELTSLNKGFVQEFQLGKRKYTLRVKAGLTTAQDKILVLILESGNASQIISTTSYFEKGDYVGDLLWVGDLDRDGKLDLYMNYYTYEKGGYGSSLFLSSEAEKGKLVKEIASFGTAGC